MNRHAPANTSGIRHVAFAVEDIDAVVAGLRARGAELVGELVRYEDTYRLCYVRGPEGIKGAARARTASRVDDVRTIHRQGGTDRYCAGPGRARHE